MLEEKSTKRSMELVSHWHNNTHAAPQPLVASDGSLPHTHALRWILAAWRSESGAGRWGAKAIGVPRQPNMTEINAGCYVQEQSGDIALHVVQS